MSTLTLFERLAYVSRMAPGIAARDVYDIIRVAHNRNSAAGLTGGLLLLDGYFIQVLEGERDKLQARFEVIARDPRHIDLDVRLRSACEGPLFPGEWMALRSDGEIDPATLERFAYQPGLPAERFSGPRVTAFVLACCSALQQRVQGDQLTLPSPLASSGMAPSELAPSKPTVL